MDTVMAVSDIRGKSGQCRSAAFADFYRRELDGQVRRASLLLGSQDRANDVVHDAFIAVFRRWDSLDDPGPYLNVVVLNGCRGVYRRRSRDLRLAVQSTGCGCAAFLRRPDDRRDRSYAELCPRLRRAMDRPNAPQDADDTVMRDVECELTEHLRNRAADVQPRYDLAAVEQGIRSIDVVRRDDRPNRRPMNLIVVGAVAALVAVAFVGLITRDVNMAVTPPAAVSTPTVATTIASTTPTSQASAPTTVPEDPPMAAFLGSWTSIDNLDNSFQTMEIVTASDGSTQMAIYDVAANVCSGIASTMIGTGVLDGGGDLVVASPALTCDDGGEPLELDPPLDDQLRNLTFAHDPRSDSRRLVRPRLAAGEVGSDVAAVQPRRGGRRAGVGRPR